MTIQRACITYNFICDDKMYKPFVSLSSSLLEMLCTQGDLNGPAESLCTQLSIGKKISIINCLA